MQVIKQSRCQGCQYCWQLFCYHGCCLLFLLDTQRTAWINGYRTGMYLTTVIVFKTNGRTTCSVKSPNVLKRYIIICFKVNFHWLVKFLKISKKNNVRKYCQQLWCSTRNRCNLVKGWCFWKIVLKLPKVSRNNPLTNM